MRRNRRPPTWGMSPPGPVVRFALFELRAAFVTILACAILLGAYPGGTPVASGAEPRVVIIVGPVGSLTDAYRADGDKAARAARAAGATVETIYSPAATWPRVRDALQGASLVVYLGHGNGWPSRYRTSPWPKTQNGLGLNPVSGIDDRAHQYFGEAYLARDVRLAPHAVVLLVHLCYASGNSEPGLPEGDLATGQQRVDNYAAGWLAAGAGAVLAEGHGGPAYYVRRILAGHGTIEQIWRDAPTAHGHVLAFPSVRTPGMTALMDPTHRSSGFYRSLVARTRMRADEVARGATQVRPRGGQAVPPAPAPAGPAITAATLDGVPTAGASLRLTLKLDKATAKAPRALAVGIRWDPIALDPPTVLPAVPGVAPPMPPPSSSAPEGTPGTAVAAAAPSVVLISPEVPGAVVNLSDVRVKRSAIAARLVTPNEPGLYRLTASLHDSDGVAFDATTQDRLPSFTVRVTAELSAVVSAIDRLRVDAGATIGLPVTVANTGHLAWVSDQPWRPAAGSGSRPVPAEWYSALVGRWMRLDGLDATAEITAARAITQPRPGASQDVLLALTAPAAPGSYLLVLDVVSPLYGSLTAVGGAPVVVRVLVEPPSDEGPPGGATPRRPDGQPTSLE